MNMPYFSRRVHFVGGTLLQMQRLETGVQEVDELTGDRGAKREQKERARSRKLLSLSLKDFEEKLQKLSRELPAGIERAAALCMLLEVAFSILVRRLDEPEEAEMLLKRWLLLSLDGQRVSNSSGTLTGHVISALLTLASLTIERDGGTTLGRRSLGRLHEQLENFCGNSKPEDLCSDHDLLSPEDTPLSAELLKSLPAAPSLSEALGEVLGTPTPRQQVQAICEAGTKDLEGLPILGLAAGREFQRLVHAGRDPKIGDLDHGSEVCPLCRMRLRLGFLIELRRDRFASCRECGGFLLAKY